MKTFRKILAILGCFVVAFVAFISFTPNKVAYADSVEVENYTFSGSPLFIPISPCQNNSDVPFNAYSISNRYNFVLETGMGFCLFSLKDASISSITLNFESILHTNFDDTYSNLGGSTTFVPVLDGNFHSYSFSLIYGYSDDPFIPLFSVFSGYYFIQSGFNFDIRRVQIWFERGHNGVNTWCLTCFHFIDSSGNVFYLSVTSYLESGYVFNFTNRTYYFGSNYDFSNNEYYQQGYGQGFNDGVADGSDSGYASGYNAGRTVGYASGYNAGLDTADYSFFDLFGSVIDAPVTVFKDLFNFELLGVNLLSLFTGLLTLAVLIWIIKLIFGKT